MRVDPAGIPSRIAHWRIRRNLSQSELGMLMNPPRSKSWVQKMESGERQADMAVGIVGQIADALHIPEERLLYSDAHTLYLECIDEVEAAAIRGALTRYDVATYSFDVPGGQDPIALDLVRRQTSYGWSSFQSAHFTNVARHLPALIVDAARTAHSDDSPAAWSAASFVCQLAAAVCVKFDDAPTAWIAADRAMAAAERSGEPVAIASAARRSAEALLCLDNASRRTHRTGTERPSDHRDSGLALDTCLHAAARLEADLLADGHDGISVLGSLYLKAAVCAADLEDVRETTALITQARRYAKMLGVDANHVGTGFGPTNVAIHEVATLSTLNEPGSALTAASVITSDALQRLPIERQVHHAADLAIAQIQAGHLDDALATLLRAEKLGSQEIHCRPRTRATVTQLADATVRPSDRLAGLAQRSGVVL